MGSAPVRRDADTLLVSSLRRNAPVGPGQPGVYGVRHKHGSSVAAPATTVGPWITPDPETECGAFNGSALSSRGDYYFPTGDFTSSLLQAYAGFDTAGAETVVGVTSYAGGGDDFHGLAQVTDVTISFVYPPYVPGFVDYPSGATGVEYESLAGVPLEDATVSGTMRISSLGESDGYDATVRTLATGASPDWFTPGELAAMDLVVTVPWLASVGGVTPASDVEWTFSEDARRYVTVWEVITQAVALSGPSYGGNATYLSLSASRLYQPPRYRFTF